MIVQSDGLQLTESLHSFCNTKLAKLERFVASDNIHVLLTMDCNESVVKIKAGKTFVSAKGSDMYSTILKALETAYISLEKSKQSYADQK